MEKYTNPQQALYDPALAIITDNIANQKELSKAYLRYKVLPKMVYGDGSLILISVLEIAAATALAAAYKNITKRHKKGLVS